jgi:hypothetical protein
LSAQPRDMAPTPIKRLMQFSAAPRSSRAVEQLPMACLHSMAYKTKAQQAAERTEAGAFKSWCGI